MSLRKAKDRADGLALSDSTIPSELIAEPAGNCICSQDSSVPAAVIDGELGIIELTNFLQYDSDGFVWTGHAHILRAHNSVGFPRNQYLVPKVLDLADDIFDRFSDRAPPIEAPVTDCIPQGREYAQRILILARQPVLTDVISCELAELNIIPCMKVIPEVSLYFIKSGQKPVASL